MELLLDVFLSFFWSHTNNPCPEGTLSSQEIKIWNSLHGIYDIDISLDSDESENELDQENDLKPKINFLLEKIESFFNTNPTFLFVLLSPEAPPSYARCPHHNVVRMDVLVTYIRRVGLVVELMMKMAFTSGNLSELKIFCGKLNASLEEMKKKKMKRKKTRQKEEQDEMLIKDEQSLSSMVDCIDKILNTFFSLSIVKKIEVKKKRKIFSFSLPSGSLSPHPPVFFSIFTFLL